MTHSHTMRGPCAADLAEVQRPSQASSSVSVPAAALMRIAERLEKAASHQDDRCAAHLDEARAELARILEAQQ